MLLAKSVEWAAAIAPYQKKMTARVSVTIIKPFTHLSFSEKIKKEEEALEKTLWPKKTPLTGKAAVIALDARGDMLSSQGLASWLAAAQQQYQKINFVIGGADGFSPAFLKKCDRVISFGAMTFPHQFMPLLLVEQLFRADSILRGTPYHGGHE